MHDSYEIYVPSKSFLIFLDIWTATLKWKTVVSSSSSYAKFTVQSGRASRAIVGCDLANQQWRTMQSDFIAPTRPTWKSPAASRCLLSLMKTSSVKGSPRSILPRHAMCHTTGELQFYDSDRLLLDMANVSRCLTMSHVIMSCSGTSPSIYDWHQSPAGPVEVTV